MKTLMWITVILVIFLMGFIVGSLVYSRVGPNVTHLAPTYALDISCLDKDGGFVPCGEPQAWNEYHSNLWDDILRHTTFTIDGKPVEITDVQVFYRFKDNTQWQERFNSSSRTWTISYFYIYGNITYYPLGIEDSQTYVAPTPIICTTPSSSCPSRSCYDIITAPPCYVVPTPTPTPRPVFTFPDMCSNGCLICMKGLGNCTYIHGRTTPTPCVAITCSPDYPTPTPNCYCGEK